MKIHIAPIDMVAMVILTFSCNSFETPQISDVSFSCLNVSWIPTRFYIAKMLVYLVFINLSNEAGDIAEKKIILKLLK